MQALGNWISLPPSALRVLGAAPALGGASSGRAPCAGHWSPDCYPFVLAKYPSNFHSSGCHRLSPPTCQSSGGPEDRSVTFLIGNHSSNWLLNLPQRCRRAWGLAHSHLRLTDFIYCILCSSVFNCDPNGPVHETNATAGILPLPELPPTCKTALPVPFLPWHERLSRGAPCPWDPSHFYKAYLLSATVTIRSEHTPANNAAEIPNSAEKWLSHNRSVLGTHLPGLKVVTWTLSITEALTDIGVNASTLETFSTEHKDARARLLL